MELLKETLESEISKSKVVKTRSQKEKVKQSSVSEVGLVKGNFQLLTHILSTLLEDALLNEERLFQGSTFKKLAKPNFIEETISDHIAMHNDLILNLGIKFGTQRYKAIANYSIQCLEGTNPPINDNRISTGKIDRWPNCLDHLRPLFHQITEENKKAYRYDQIIRTILSIPRMVSDFSEINLDSIEQPGPNLNWMRSDFREFLKAKFESPKWGIKVSKCWYQKPSIRNNTTGPLGKPRWDNIDVEAKLLLDSPLWKHFNKLCSLVGAEELSNMVIKIGSQVNDLPNLVRERRIKNPTLRKIESVPDSGNKSRSIAIGDIYTQTLLKPLEEDILKIIKLKYSDNCNIFDHQGGFRKLQQFLREDIASIDASNWTDRLPAILQKDVLEFLYSKDISNEWYKLVVKCPWHVSDTGKITRYAVGQGMGIHASFAIATLTDLLLIEFAHGKYYNSEYKDWYRTAGQRQATYNKIGDDLWIYDPQKKFTEFYERIGITINAQKSKHATKENLVAEFVSMNISKGQNVSRISSRLCREVEQNIFMLPILIEHLNQRLEKDLVQNIVLGLTKVKIFDRKKFLLEELAKMSILEFSTFGTDTYITQAGELLQQLVSEVDSEAGYRLEQLQLFIRSKDSVVITIGLLLSLLDREWSLIEKHLGLLAADLKDDKNTYYQNRALPVVDERWFDPRLFENNPLDYITNLTKGLAIRCKNDKINPYIFRGIDHDGEPQQIIVKIREMLKEVEMFAQSFLPLESRIRDTRNFKYRMHCLHTISKLLVRGSTENIYDVSGLKEKFVHEFDLLSEVTQVELDPERELTLKDH